MANMDAEKLNRIRLMNGPEALANVQNLFDEKSLDIFASLIAGLPAGIILQTIDGKILLANPKAAQIHGYNVEEITATGFSFEQLVTPKDQEKVNNVLKKLLLGEVVEGFRFLGLRKDGSEFHEEVCAGLVSDIQGKPFGFLVIGQDISDQKNLFEAEQKNRALAEALINSAALLSSTLHLDEVLEKILELVGQVVAHDSANIMLIDGGILRVVRARGYKTPELHDFTMSVTSKVEDFPSMMQMIRDGLPIMIPDTREYAGWFTAEGFSWLLSYLGAPLKVKGKTIGVINLDSEKPNFFKEDDAYRLQAFADLAAMAIENANLYESLEQQASESSALFRASTALLNTSSDIDNLAEQIVQTVHRDFTTAHCAVLFVDESNSLLYRISQAGYETTNISPLDYKETTGITIRALRQKKPVYVPDVRQEPDYYMGSKLTRSEFDIPFISGDKVIGLLNMESTEIDGFNERARRVLITYAKRASIALENARLFKNLQKRDYQITLLNRITQISLVTSDLKQMLTIQARLLLETFSPDGVIFCFSDPFLRKITNGYAISTDAKTDLMLNKIVHENTFSLQLSNIPNSVVTSDVIHKNIRGSDTHNPFMAYILRELNADGIHLGSVAIGYLNSREFDESEIDFFVQAANQLALAIAKNLSITTAMERAREAESLREATSTLTSTLNLQEVMEKILGVAVNSIPSAQKGLLFLYDQEKNIFIVRAQFGYSDPEVFSIRLNQYEGLAGKVVSEKRAMLFKDVQSEPNPFFMDINKEASSQNCWIVAPLLQQGKIFGVIELSAAETDVFSENDLKVLVSFADTVTAAIQNAQLHAEVQQIALTDTLSGLSNRRGFVEFGQREILRVQRTGAPLSMLLIDVDYLKQINDEFGHNAGDQVLREVAECCRQTFRQTDLVSRYGGDEFAILLPDTSLDNAREAAERFRQSISSRIFVFEGTPIKLSVSIGGAKFNKSLNSVNDFFNMADKALYSAKKMGRNAIAFWDNVPPTSKN